MPLVDTVTTTGMSQVSRDSASKSLMPIELLPTGLASIVTHLHSAILLGAYCLRFPALVADPVSTLTRALVVVTVSQISYCLCCLPISGSNARPTKRAQKIKGGAPKKQNDGSTLSTKVLHVILSLLMTILTIPVILIIQILLGAPLTTHIPHTLLSSAHFTILVIFPLIYVHGIDGSKWMEILSAQSPMDEVFGAAIGAVLGAWLGAIPIPLDWDREWQKWPVTIVTGMYLTYTLGKLLGGSVLRGTRIKFD